MDPNQLAVAINQLLLVAFNLHQALAQISGDVPIPTWDEMSNKNAILQKDIDAEKTL